MFLPLLPILLSPLFHYSTRLFNNINTKTWNANKEKFENYEQLPYLGMIMNKALAIYVCELSQNAKMSFPN